MSLRNYLSTFPWGAFFGKGYGGTKPYNSRQRLVVLYAEGKLRFAGFQLVRGHVGQLGARYACRWAESFDVSETSWKSLDFKLPRGWATAHTTFLLGLKHFRSNYTRSNLSVAGIGRVAVRDLESYMSEVQDFGYHNKVNLHLFTAAGIVMGQSWWQAQSDWRDGEDLRFCIFDDGSQAVVVGGNRDGLIALQPAGNVSEVPGLLADYGRTFRKEGFAKLDTCLSAGEFTKLSTYINDSSFTDGTKLVPYSFWSSLCEGTPPPVLGDSLAAERLAGALPVLIR
jgi:hypothetical protein